MNNITSATVTNIPGGQPAVTPSPLEDAFQVLAGYVGGQTQARAMREKQSTDLLGHLVDTGALNVDLSGGLAAPKYIPVPMEKRPAYLEQTARAQYYGAESAKSLSDADLNKVLVQTQQNVLNQQNKGVINKAHVALQTFVSNLPRDKKLEFKMQMANPMSRKSFIDKFSIKYQGVPSALVEQWLNETE